MEKVTFEEEVSGLKTMPPPARHIPGGIIGTLIRNGIASDVRTANLQLIVLFVLMVLAAIAVFVWG